MTARRRIIAANWKMNKGVEDTIKFLTPFLRHYSENENVDIVICPPFTSLYTASVALQESVIWLGAQNCHEQESGAFTGEVSAAFLKEQGCTYVIVGHSERRQYFGESDELILKKVQAVFAQDMRPIFCVGETEKERDAGKTYDVLKRQIDAVIAHLSKSEIETMVIAYEPVWAIGTGKVATPEQANEAHEFIRNLVSQHSGTAYGSAVRILYGGSVKPENVPVLLKQPHVDGALVGGASLEVESFLSIVQQAGLTY